MKEVSLHRRADLIYFRWPLSPIHNMCVLVYVWLFRVTTERIRMLLRLKATAEVQGTESDNL